jgi:cardiolipin synthase
MRRLPALALVALALIACASLPTIVPDLARTARAPVPIEGARGPLSAERSKAILDGLARRGQPTDIFERHLALEEAIVGSPLTTGNEVLLLQDGPATYRAMLAAIAGAREHVHMETYIFDDDEEGRRFAGSAAACRCG